MRKAVQKRFKIARATELSSQTSTEAMFLFTFVLLNCIYFSSAQTIRGVAVMSAAPGSPGGDIKGTVTFTAEGPGMARVNVQVSGLKAGSDGPHGMHVHTFGDLRGFLSNAGSRVAGGLAAAGHYDPANTGVHTCENEAFVAHHRGDLGNWNVVNGAINQNKLIPGLNLTGSESIIGRMIMLDARRDDCSTLPSGNTGESWALGVIGIANVADNIASSSAPENKAVCVFQGTDAFPGALGQFGLVTLETTSTGGVLVRGRVVTGDNKEHGFHAHTFGDITATDGTSAGPHYNKHSDHVHGLPNDDSDLKRHAGDFGSLRHYDTNANAFYELIVSEDYDKELLLSDFIGRALIVHQDLDHGNEPSCPGASENGASGSRYLMCVIGIMNPLSTVNASADTSLELPMVPSSITIDRKWRNTPCSVSTPTNGNGNAPTSTAPYDQGLSGGAVVGILIAVFFVVAVIVAVIAFLFIKGGACSGGDSSDNYSKL